MVNLDFNDVRTVISMGGDAIMGLGEHSGEERAVEAARKAINSPLLEDVSIAGAKGVLINIASDSNLTLYEVNEVMSLINEAAGSDAEIIFGTVIDDSLTENIRVTVIATGFSLSKGGEAEPPPVGTQEEPVQDVESDPLAIGSPVLVGGGGTSLDVPTYLRNGHSTPQEDQEESVRPAVDDLDIPTFLRRKMNAS